MAQSTKVKMTTQITSGRHFGALTTTDGTSMEASIQDESDEESESSSADFDAQAADDSATFDEMDDAIDDNEACEDGSCYSSSADGSGVDNSQTDVKSNDHVSFHLTLTLTLFSDDGGAILWDLGNGHYGCSWRRCGQRCLHGAGRSGARAARLLRLCNVCVCVCSKIV